MSDAVQIDINTETWRAVSEWAERHRTDALKTISVHGLSTEDTEYQRGRIAAFDDLLGLPLQKPFTKSQPIR